jgi:hypothetical protein
MSATRFNRLTRPNILKRIARSHLQQFLGTFAEGFLARGLALPDPAQPDAAWFEAVAALLRTSQGLPPALHEAVATINEMAQPEAQEQLEAALAKAGSPLRLEPDSSSEDLAVQAWLAAPELLTRVLNQLRMRRLASFECFRHRPVNAEPAPAPAVPDASAIERLTAVLDAWFARHNRGQQTVRIEVYPGPAPAPGSACPEPGELWFLVQHGDTITRRPTVDHQQRGIVRFRPEKDDVVVISPGQDELRINARTKGQRELYRQEFGRLWRGDPEYFCERETYTLEPLRTWGRDALSVHGLAGIYRITLQQLQVVNRADPDQVTTYEATDLFAPADTDPGSPVIPANGLLAWAAFQIHFTGARRPELVQIRPPNFLKVSRNCDLWLLGQWLRASGIKLVGTHSEARLSRKSETPNPESENSPKCEFPCPRTETPSQLASPTSNPESEPPRTNPVP